LARRQKYRREKWRKCPKTGLVVSFETCEKCEDKLKCNAEWFERKVRRGA